MDNFSPHRNLAPELPRSLFGYRRATVDQYVRQRLLADEVEERNRSDEIQRLTLEIMRQKEHIKTFQSLAEQTRMACETLRLQWEREQQNTRFVEEGVRQEAERLNDIHRQRLQDLDATYAAVDAEIKVTEQKLWQMAESLTRVLQDAQTLATQELNAESVESLWADFCKTVIGQVITAPEEFLDSSRSLMQYRVPRGTVQLATRQGVVLGFLHAVIISRVPARIVAYRLQSGHLIGQADIQVLRLGHIMVKNHYRCMEEAQLRIDPPRFQTGASTSVSELPEADRSTVGDRSVTPPGQSDYEAPPSARWEEKSPSLDHVQASEAVRSDISASTAGQDQPETAVSPTPPCSASSEVEGNGEGETASWEEGPSAHAGMAIPEDGRLGAEIRQSDVAARASDEEHAQRLESPTTSTRAPVDAEGNGVGEMAPSDGQWDDGRRDVFESDETTASSLAARIPTSTGTGEASSQDVLSAPRINSAPYRAQVRGEAKDNEDVALPQESTLLPPSWHSDQDSLKPRMRDLSLPGVEEQDPPKLPDRAHAPVSQGDDDSQLPGLNRREARRLGPPSWTDRGTPGSIPAGAAVRQASVPAVEGDEPISATLSVDTPVSDAGGIDVRTFLYGKRVGKDIRDAAGNLVASAGEIITPALVQRVEEAGFLPELIVHMVF